MPMMNAAQWLFLLTGLTLAYLVLPPFFFILHTSLVIDRGLQAGSFTLQHFEPGSLNEVMPRSAGSPTSRRTCHLPFPASSKWLAGSCCSDPKPAFSTPP